MMNTNQYLAIIILINLSAGMVLSTMYSNQTISDYDQNKLNTMSQLPEDVQAAQDDSSYLAGDNEYDKTYRIAQELKAAGIHKKDLKPEDFEQGFIKTRQMITIKQTAEIDKVGTFKPEQRNLKEQQQRFKETQQILKEKQLFVDDNPNF